MGNSPHKGYHTRGYLPHFDRPGILQFITFHLADSLPHSALERIEDEQRRGNAKRRLDYENALDKGIGACWLNIPEVAQVIEAALFYFHGERYELIAWVIMPNHVHVLVEIREGYPLSSIVHSWKSFTSKRAKEILRMKGDEVGKSFWYKDYYDRFIRDEKHFNACFDYIHNNPIKAGLVDRPEDWPWSSASASSK